jgi:hypothetical protein
MLDQVLSCTAIGGAERVRQGIEAFAQRTQADELMITSQVFDHAKRLASYEITARCVGQA